MNSKPIPLELVIDETSNACSKPIDDFFQSISHTNISFQTYEEFCLHLDRLISKYNTSINEADYRFSMISFQHEEMKNILSKHKYKSIGKIGKYKTHFNKPSMFGDINTFYDDNKIEGKENFSSCRTNNCVTQGKWCYEVVLYSNGLQQIGWCQLNTSFTFFKGVGDDETSFSYDGYRASSWHIKNNSYGSIWDIGDVIGICINLDDNFVEFFHNGVSQGIAYKGIDFGENIAYFPAITFCQYEKSYFNFGTLPFYFEYPSYNSIDIPQSKYNNNMDTTMAILNLIQNVLFKLLSTDNKDLKYLKFILNQKLLSYLTVVSFEDFFLCKTLLFPFLFNVSQQNIELFNLLINEIRFNCSMNRNIDFFDKMFNKLLNIIEETSLIGSFMIKEWKQFMTLFILIIQNENLFIQWINGSSIIPQLKMIFNSNTLNLNCIYSFITSQFKDILSKSSSTHILKLLMGKTDIFEEAFYINEQAYQENICQFLSTFFLLADSTNSLLYCINLLLRLIKEGYNLDCLYKVNIDSFCLDKNKINSQFIKNLLYNNMYSFLEEYQNVPLSRFSIISNVNNKDSSYFLFLLVKDDNLCATKIDNIISDYFLNTDDLLRESDMIPSLKFHLILKTSICIEMFFQGYHLLYENSKGNKLDFKIEDRGTAHLSIVFRNYFYLFNEECQKTLYKMAFFAIKWFNSIFDKGEPYIYCLSTVEIKMPYSVLKIIVTFNSAILSDISHRKKINESSLHFTSDNFIEECLTFYSRLFSLENIYNNDLTLLLVNYMLFFFTKSVIYTVIIENKTILNYINKGLKRMITLPISPKKKFKLLSKIILFQLANNLSFFPFDHYMTLFNVSNTKSLFTQFIDEYSRKLNTKMTNYIFTLDYCKELIIKQNCQMNGWFPFLNELRKEYKAFCKGILIYEFAIVFFPTHFFENSSLLWIQFKSFIVNVTSRILNDPYLSELEVLLDKYDDNKKDSLLKLASSISGIFICIQNNNTYSSDCMKAFIQMGNLMMEPFHILLDKIQPLLEEKDSPECDKFNSFKKIIQFIQEEKDKNAEYIKKNNIKVKEEDLCILCYDLISNQQIVPCGHIACHECLKQYMVDQDKCFICMKEIENVINYNPL